MRHDLCHKMVVIVASLNLWPILKVVETASGLTPEEEAKFLQQRATAPSAAVSEAFALEVETIQS